MKRDARGAASPRAPFLNHKSQIANRKFPRPAFTLIELLLVLAIISIVVAIVAPNLRGFSAGRSTSNTATSLLSMARYARTQAIAEGRTYRLNYDEQANAFTVTCDDGSNNFTAPSNEFGQPLTMANGITLAVDIPNAQRDGQYVSFFSTGRTEPAKFTLSDATGSVIQIACSSATEQFRIVPAAEVMR